MQPIYADLKKFGASRETLRFFQDVATRIDKNLTNTGSIIAGTPLPNAVDANGNLLLKNIDQVVGQTAGPTTASASFVVIPEMTKTITAKGNPISIDFNSTFQVDTLASLLTLQIFRDGVAIGIQAQKSWPGVSYFDLMSIFMDDQPAAGQHTYDVRWKVSSGNATAVGTNRALQIVEQG